MKTNRSKTVFRPGQWSNYFLVGITFLTLCWWNVAHGQSNVRILEPGDVVLSINGENIYGRNDMIDAVNQSPRTMNMTVRDSRTGGLLHLQVTLNQSFPRLGVDLKDAPGGGAMITSLSANSPARRCVVVGSGGGGTTPQPPVGGTVSLEVGDVILSVNGERVNSHAELTNAVNRSSGTMDFTLRDSRSGGILDLQVTLNQNSPRFGIYSQAASGGGARITGFTANSPARRCIKVESPPSGQPRVHIIVLQTDEKEVAPACEVSVNNVLDLFSEYNNKTMRRLQTSVGISRINDAINATQVGSNDVLFFYYAGHGGCLPDQEHYLVLESADRRTSENLMRRDIRQTLRAKNARLTVLITDCCSSVAGQELEVAYEVSERQSQLQRNLQRLFSVSGFVDVTSASFREYGWICNGQQIFTEQLCSLLTDKPYSTWRSLMADVQTATMQSFAARKESIQNYLQSYQGDRNDPLYINCKNNWELYMKNQQTQKPWLMTLP